MKTITRRTLAGGIALLPTLRFPAAHAQSVVNPAEARAIAKEAYIYGFPFVEGYKTLYKQAVDKSSPEFKAPFNLIGHARGAATPERVRR